MFFNPLTFMFMIIFLVFILFFFIIIQINVIALVFAEIGIPSQYVFAALFATLFGSFINIPVKKIPQEEMCRESRVSVYGFSWVIPVLKKRRETIIAVNLGGAVIPTLLSSYLILKTGLWGRSLLATAFVALVAFRLSKPVRGVGITLPPFFPPILAAVVSVIIAYHYAPVVAYISGTMGTLIGADLFNLKRIQKLGAPVASIGGAGTFDGIFLNGIFAVLLAALLA